MNLDDPEDRLVASGEFVLGTLTPQETDAVIARMSVDAQFAAMVAYWQERLLPIARRTTPVEPSRQLWQRIDAAVLALPRGSEAGGTATASAAARPVSTRRAEEGAAERDRPARGARTPVWQRLGWWRAIGALGMAMSLLLAVLLVRQATAPDAVPPAYVAALQAGDGSAGWLVQAAADGPVRLVPLAPPGQPPAGRAWELWTKPQGADAPTSLGLVPAGNTLLVPRAALPALEDGQLFEISLEPEAGSPTGRPTGPVLFIGKGRRI
ncbi:MAG: anti-sigma factor [Lautropia sp.]